MLLCSKAPTRISFAGGGTDIPEIAAQIGGCVTSASISRYVLATLEKRGDKKISMRSVKMDGTEELVVTDKIKYDGRLDLIKSVVEEFGVEGVNITVTSEVPERSGLGASASAYAALISLMCIHKGVKMSRNDIAELSFRLERDKLKNRVGKQDQYAACYGGINYMEFSKDMRVDVFPIEMDESAMKELEENIALFHVTDRAKRAGDVIQSQTKSAISYFEKTKELGMMAKEALENSDVEGFGKVMGLVWEYKRKFSADTTTPFIEAVHETAVRNGAYGGKISGAGGGGCGFWFCRRGTKQKVVSALERLGAKHLEFRFDLEGVKAWKR